MKTYLNIAYGVLIGLLAGGIIWLATSRPRGEAVVLLPTPTLGTVTVYITGAVATPGVYVLPEESRLDAAIKAAGGFVPGAEQESINLAQPLKDGQQVNVPGIVDTSHVNAGRVNINSATVTELDTLPGIGPTTAQSIVDYRLENGPFLTIQDIENVPGVGPATYADIQDYITVGP
ncbi:MAG TPA: ComEA family DNA-binding protein [Anaerolineales bacterium]|nr:ComEA family DNA-binding protein [Anaerolineales bacterium]